MKKPGSKGQEKLLLTEALRRFCDVEMPARNLSPETRRGYTYDLSEWVATTSPSLSVSALSTDVIAHYLSGLDARGLKGSTRHRKVAAIKTLLRYLEREGALGAGGRARGGGPAGVHRAGAGGGPPAPRRRDPRGAAADRHPARGAHR